MFVWLRTWVIPKTLYHFVYHHSVRVAWFCCFFFSTGSRDSWGSNILNKIAKAKVFSFRVLKSSPCWWFKWDFIGTSGGCSVSSKSGAPWFLASLHIDHQASACQTNTESSPGTEQKHCWSLQAEHSRVFIINWPSSAIVEYAVVDNNPALDARKRASLCWYIPSDFQWSVLLIDLSKMLAKTEQHKINLVVFWMPVLRPLILFLNRCLVFITMELRWKTIKKIVNIYILIIRFSRTCISDFVYWAKKCPVSLISFQ